MIWGYGIVKYLFMVFKPCRSPFYSSSLLPVNTAVSMAAAKFNDSGIPMSIDDAVVKFRIAPDNTSLVECE
jgi:hypothetical protein